MSWPGWPTAPTGTRFVPFSLSQAHVEPGEADVRDEPERDSGLLALQVGVVVRDWFPSSSRPSTGRSSRSVTTRGSR